MPGLERLLATCDKYPVKPAYREPWAGAPGAGEYLLGRPVDPMLATFYTRLGGLHLNLDLYVDPCVEQVDGLRISNEDAQRYWPEPFRSLFVFGGQDALSYCYATVPTLANDQGLQPVVEINPYEDIYAIPLASSVDRFFDTYARFLEFWHEPSELNTISPDRPAFPWDIPHIIANDRPLMEMIVEGRFDFLMFDPPAGNEDSHKHLRKWIETLRATAP